MGSNNRFGHAAAHAADQLELYLAGALTTEQVQWFEEHLLLCAACQERADQDSEIAVLVAALPAAMVADIEREGMVAPPKTTSQPADRRSTATTSRQGASGAGPGPAGGRPPGRPGGRARRALSYAVVLLASAVFGVGGGLIYARSDAAKVTVGNETNPGTYGQLYVTATGSPDGVSVRAIMVGLRPGGEYDLVAVGKDGRNHVAAHGVAAGGPQTIVGAAPMARDQIWFFALTQGNLLLVSTDF